MENQIVTAHGIVNIRPAQQADAEAYCALRLEGLRDYPEAFGSDYDANQARPTNYWSERLNALGSQSMIYFAEHNQALIGMCGIYRGDSLKTQHSAMLVGVYLQPAWRGLQIAIGLMDACLDWARYEGVRIVKLGVATNNTPAIRRYVRSGFTIYGVEPQALFVNGRMLEEFLMARSL